jgi:hypothetical protein
MPKRRSDDDDADPEWAWHLGHFGMGHISQLSDKDPPGKPYEPFRGPLGFDITPGQDKRGKRGRNRKAKANSGRRSRRAS